MVTISSWVRRFNWMARSLALRAMPPKECPQEVHASKPDATSAPTNRADTLAPFGKTCVPLRGSNLLVDNGGFAFLRPRGVVLRHVAEVWDFVAFVGRRLQIFLPFSESPSAR